MVLCVFIAYILGMHSRQGLPIVVQACSAFGSWPAVPGQLSPGLPSVQCLTLGRNHLCSDIDICFGVG